MGEQQSAASPAPATSGPKFQILVAGDAIVDHHIYEGERHAVSQRSFRGLRSHRELGGACLIDRLLQFCFSEALAARREKLQAGQLELLRLKKETDDLAAIGNTDEQKSTVLTNAIKAVEKGLAENAPALPESHWRSRFALQTPDLHSEPSAHHALATWKPFPLEPGNKDGKRLVWRADVLLGYGHEEPFSEADVNPTSVARDALETKETLSEQTRIVVLDDGGFLFRQERNAAAWLLPAAETTSGSVPDWYVLKMTDPVAQGDLWTELVKRREDAWGEGETRRPDIGDRLVVIVAAAHLRRESARLSRGLSWESTVEDFHKLLTSDGPFRSLAELPRHLIITFGADGALWLDNTDREHPTAYLVFDAGGAEGGWDETYSGHGTVFGFLSCLTASVARSLALRADDKKEDGKIDTKVDLRDAMAAGLAAMRDLRRNGHGAVESQQWPHGFPAKRLARVINKGTGDFARQRVPWTAAEWQACQGGASRPRRPWRILESSQVAFGSTAVPSMLGLARQFVIYGSATLNGLPHARFGALVTADRQEIETLRTLRRLMLDYKADTKAKKPLSIGVFGPPGAGKSFGVKQIATDKTIFGDGGWKEFNLSQFQDDDLIGAFHQIRDLVLSGITPVVFWDEFDSRDYHWLQYLLAPMQDGRFQEKQITHPIGKCVFIFAGGTAHRYEEFGPPPADEEAMKAFRLKKGPDFHSRLDAFYNVLGPNQRLTPKAGDPKAGDPKAGDPKADDRDSQDICTPLRRAIMIRNSLGMSKSPSRLDIDRPLVDSLLEVGKYKHGARSLEKLVVPMAPARPSDPVRPSALPPWPIVAMHVAPFDGAATTEPAGMTFDKLLETRGIDPFADESVIELLAEWIHLSWKAIYSETKPSDEPISPHSDKSYHQLSEEIKDDNRAAARRIPDILALVGLAIEKEPDAKKQVTPDPTIQQHLEHHLDVLAQAEHDGWMDQKVRYGWRWGATRNNSAKIHDCLIEFKELIKHQKDKDRDSIRHFQEHLARAGLRIVFAS